MIRRLFLVSALLCATLPSTGQNIIVSSAVGQDVESFVRTHFVGEGVHIFNVKFNNTPGTVAMPQLGSFQSNGFDLINMQEGLLLTTGNVSVAEGPNDLSNASQLVGNYYSDPVISVVSSGTVKACATLDFDLVCLSDHFSFNYFFGSEEYPDFVGSRYNDVFAFFLTGVDPATGLGATRNIALVPGSVSEENPNGIAVAINSINPGVPGSMGYSGVDIHPEYSGFYRANVENADGVQYNGFTQKLEATATLVPCEVYHMHISICNIGDNNRDSGVMIEGGSLTSRGTRREWNFGEGGTVLRSAGLDYPLSLAGSPYTLGRTHLSFGGELIHGIDFHCITDSGVLIDTVRDYMYIDQSQHYFTLRGTEFADLSQPRTIEVYLATELCPLYPQLVVYDTLRFVMVDDPADPDPDPESVAETGLPAPLSVYPNPTSGCLTVAGEGLQRVELLDAEGRVVLVNEGRGDRCQLDTSALPAGVYHLRALNSRGVRTASVVVK